MGALFRNRAFILVWLAQAASGLGGTFAVFVESWLVYDLTGSKMAMGSLFMTFMTASVITQIWSGPFLDRWDRRTVMVLSEWLRAAAYLIPAVMFVLNELQVWHLFLATLLAGIAEPLFRPSSMAYIPNILPKDNLVRGNAFLEGTMNLMTLVGPAAGGLTLHWLGAGTILFCLVALLGGSGLILWFLPRDQQPRGEGKQNRWVSQFKEGLRFYKVKPILLGTGLLIMIGNLGFGATQPMMLPYVIDILEGEAWQFGLLTSSFSVGMLVGSIYMSVIGEPKNRRLYMLGASGIMGFSLALLGITRVFSLALTLVVVSGFAAILYNVLNTTLYQRFVPKSLRGRVFTIRILLAQSGMPLGAFLGGAFAEMWGIPLLFVLAGGIALIATGIAWFHPLFWQLNEEITESEIEKIAS